MKKISKIALFTIIVLLLSMVPVKAADSYTTSAVIDKAKVNKGEEFTLLLSAKGIPQDATKVFTAKVDFDDTILEYSKKTGKSGWQVVVSTDGTSITANAEATEGEEVVALTFKVKETVDITKIASTVISITDVKVALEEDAGNKDRIVSGCTAKLNIGKVEEPAVEPTSEEPKEDPMPVVEPAKKEETKTTDPTTSQAKSQPNTGLETTILPVVIAVFMIISIVSYTSYRKINKIV